MGRMDLHSAHLPLRREAFDVPFRILRAFRMDGAKRDQALSVLLRELADEPVHILREAHHFGRDVVDQARPLDAGSVERACLDRKSTRLNSSHITISYAVFC